MPDGERLRVLLADDDEDLREVAGLLFDHWGFDLTAVASGDDALAALAAARFDVVVLDENMPRGNGIDVVEARRAAGDTTPMVLWTGADRPLDADARARLAVTVVSKTDVQALARTVAELAAEVR